MGRVYSYMSTLVRFQLYECESEATFYENGAILKKNHENEDVLAK